MQFEEAAGIFVIQETRTQTQATRFRVPDIAILDAKDLPDRIVRRAPLVCIEIMSPEDRLNRLCTKCEDYLRMGVPAVWIFDEPAKTAHLLNTEALSSVRDGMLEVPGKPAAISVKDLFEAARKRRTMLR